MNGFKVHMMDWLRIYGDGVLIMVLAGWLLFSHLDGPLMEPDESRYAEIPRLMLRTGDWITPKLQGKPYNDKPPLVYWLIAKSYQVFGVSIEAARLVPAAAGWLTLLFVYLWSRYHFGRQTASMAAFIMLTMVGYLAMMRMLLLDGVLAMLVVGSLLAGHQALTHRRHPGWWLISAILCGLGVLAKGPVAIVLVTPCLFALRWLDRTTTPMRFFDAVWYGIVVFALAAPWYLVMMATNESFGSEHFFRHHFRRFFDPAHHQAPFWYYLPALLIELLPWPLLLIAVGRRWRSWTGTERFLLFFSALCFVFFSIARAKLPTYLLPMLPILAVVLGRELGYSVKYLTRSMMNTIQVAQTATFSINLLQQKPSAPAVFTKRMMWGIGSALVVLLLALAFRSWGFYYALQVGTRSVDYVALIVLVALCVTFLAVVENWNSIWQQRFWQMTVLAALFTSVWITQRAIPDYAHAVCIVEECQQLMQLAKREGIPYVAHRNSWDAVSFQLNREELEVYSSRESAEFQKWLKDHPRSMVWMRDYESRVEAFTKALPIGVEVEKVYDLGRVQGIIVKQAGVVPAGYQSTPRQ